MDDTTLMMAASAIGLFGIAAGLAALTVSRRRTRNAHRLSSAFDRAKYARRTGTMGSDRGYIQ